MKLSRRGLLRWHVWLGWLVGVPLVLWTVTGLVMVARPIEEVRGEPLRKASQDQPLRLAKLALPFGALDRQAAVKDARIFMQDGRPVALVTRLDGHASRFDARTGAKLDPLDERQARELVARTIIGGENAATTRLFDADHAPFDFRKPMPVWQVALADGTHVYVGRETGQIEAIRTRWWRLFDFMWGLHIMDLQTREDTHHPILVLFAALSAIGTILGCILMIRRYGRPRPRA